MQLLLIRHGQSTNNLAAETGSGEAGREPDPPLTELGHWQADALANWLADAGWIPDRLYSSLMTRTIQTATPIAARFGLRIDARGDLHEAGGPYLGPYLEATPHPGSTRTQLAGLTDLVALPDLVTDQGWWAAEVETNAVAFQRAQSVVTWLVEQAARTDAAERVAIVAHGAFLSMVLTALLAPNEAAAAAQRWAGGAEDLPIWFQFENTSTSLINLADPSTTPMATVGWVNRIDHLGRMPLGGHSLTSDPFPPAPPTPS